MTPDEADALYGKALPERTDPKLEAIARLVYSYKINVTDQGWKRVWEFHTDAYADALSGGSSLLKTAKAIRDLL